MSGLLALLLISATLAEGLRSGSSAEYVVYPRLLEARGINGEKILQITEQLSLSLEKSSAIADKLVVSSTNGAEQVDTIVDGKEVVKNIYYDKSKMAAVSVSEQNGTVEVSGALGPTLRIAPLPLMGHHEGRYGAHKVFEIEEPEGHRIDYKGETQRNWSAPNIPAPAQIPSVFLVEVAMVFDQHHRKQFKTTRSLVRYAGVAVQLVNMRYDVTSHPRVQFILVAVLELTEMNTIMREVVARDKLKPPGYTKRYIRATQTLENLKEAINSGRIEVTADLVTLVTSGDLAHIDDGIISNNVIGSAKIGGVCQYCRVAETEDQPHTYIMVSTLAHEWGHSLGMVHDGEAAKYSTPAYQYAVCDPKAGYLMSPFAFGAREGQWSKCSLAHLKKFVRTLDQACFDVTSQTRYRINMKELPGAKMTKNQLCREAVPNFGPMISRGVPESDPKIAKAPLGKMPIIETPFERFAIDLIGPFSPSSDTGNHFILTLVDCATRYPDAVALPSINSETVAEGLIQLFSRVGVPREILSDQALTFTSALVKEVACLLSIQQLTNAPYHPMCNGMVEKFNGTLKTMFRKMCQEKPRQRDRYITPLLFTYREVPQRSLDFSLFTLIYGRHIRGPMTILKELWTNDTLTEEVQKKYFDEESQNRQLRVGDRALLLLPTTQNKLLMAWKGPFPVVGTKEGYDYLIELGHP
ncbi:venom metalloproteinase antarease-like TtrivMP_A [Ixodes scapularis]|uniref:venom metalloproteinase antarease-like TtrivMP_A n=1 Tax=Ixodes scapularis TaxID=6945 RepID=UPI001A9E6543|nr:venom metalloproteinase antarease-like TtrivMP_A [Ixodes scapularis]